MNDTKFIDFQAIKDAVTIEQVAQMLGLQMKRSGHQLRGPCPFCRSGGERALAVTPAKAAFYCFGAGKGGDCIALAAHIRGVPQREAAELIGSHFGLTKSSPSPPAPERKQGGDGSGGGFEPLPYLEAAHEAVEAVGFDPEMAKTIGIGFAPKGILRGTVAIPIRMEDGTLVGYIGIQEALMPTKWHLPTSNVVPLKKPA